MKLNLVMWMMVFVLFAGVVSASTISQEGYTIYGEYSRNAVSYNATNAQLQGQGFNITGSGNYTISSISFRVNKTTTEAGDTLKVQVLNDIGIAGQYSNVSYTNAVIYGTTGTIASADIPVGLMTSVGRLQFNFSTALSLESNKKYVAVLLYNGTSTGVVRTGYNASGTYSGGNGTRKAEDWIYWIANLGTTGGQNAELDFAIEFINSTSITISEIYPANQTNTTIQLNASFKYDSSNSKDGNCTLYINGVANATNNSIADGATGRLYSSGLATGLYNWSIGCLADGIEETFTANRTYYLDSTSPSCNFASSYSVADLDTGFNFNVTCTDEHFYSLNVSCDSGWNFSVDGLDVSIYNFTEHYQSNSSFTSDSCAYEYADGHTANDASNIEFIEKESSLELLKDARQYARFYTETKGVVIKGVRMQDRIAFDVDLSASVGEDFIFYYDVLDDAHYLKSNEYEAWIVSLSSKSWFDLNNYREIKPKVKRVNDTTWELSFKTKEKKVMFESTGALNSVSGSFTIDSAWEDFGIFSPFSCPFSQDDIALSIGFGMIYFLMFFVIAINIALIRIPILDGIMAIMTIIISVTLWDCNKWFMYFFIVFGFSYLLYAIVRASSAMNDYL